MAPKSSDSWLWVTLATLGYFGSFAVHRQLVAIRQASEVTRRDKRPNISQQTEDALKLKALAELLESPDPNIRAASVNIITNRANREGPTWDMFMRDIAGTDIKRRDKALACLRFLCRSFSRSKQAEIVICRHSTFKAIVDCLCNLLPEARIAEKDPTLRTQPERDAVHFLYNILEYDVAKALEAGVISRWLARYPFGGEDAPKDEKKKTIMDLLDDGPFYEDTCFRSSMRAVLWVMSNNPSLQKETVKHGLLDIPKGNDNTVGVNLSGCEKPPWTDHVQDEWSVQEAHRRTYPSTDGMGRGIPIGTNNRPREESFEEQALRRRRREAMVLGEVGRPIERADIIERDSAAPDEFRSQAIPSLSDGMEEESEQPVAAVADEEVEEYLELLMEKATQPDSMRHWGWWSWLSRLRPDGLAPEPL